MATPTTTALVARQLWNNLDASSTDIEPLHCTPFVLPSNGIIQLDDTLAITLTSDVTFQPYCTGTPHPDQVFWIGNLRDPFYSSVIPMVYVIAAATVIAWILVVMLTITPRTQFNGLPTHQAAFTNSHGIIGGANGGATTLSGAGGSRPWLQQVATLSVAISLTIATADTISEAQFQYVHGYLDATVLSRGVFDSLELRIARVISDIFLWLAQVQTLIRLFPRHKEKVLIKWIGFVLIILDTIFSCLNLFVFNSPYKGRHFVDAIPALSYLFDLALGLLYAAWVLYYSMTKRRYAYYHPKMRSISLIAALSVIAILTPVVFFVTDVVNNQMARWGDYFRWVGAAAASVVVWEWVERIEALERDDKKDGVLGREIFDGDEMLDFLPNDNARWRRNLRRRSGDGAPGGAQQSSRIEHGLSGVTQRFRRPQHPPHYFPLGRAHFNVDPNYTDEPGRSEQYNSHVTYGERPSSIPQANPGILGTPSVPVSSTSPVSRTDTHSAVSTVYVVRHHSIADVPQPIRRTINVENENAPFISEAPRRSEDETVTEKDFVEVENTQLPDRDRPTGIWNAVSNPFKRKRPSPPEEVQRACAPSIDDRRTPAPARSFSTWDFKDRLGALAAETGDRLRKRAAGRKQHASFPLTVIPAQPRGRAWNPEQQNSSAVSLGSGSMTERASASMTERILAPASASSDSPTTLSTLHSAPRSIALGSITHSDAEHSRGSTQSSAPPPLPGPSEHRLSRSEPSRSGNKAGPNVIVVPAPPRRMPHAPTVSLEPAQSSTSLHQPEHAQHGSSRGSSLQG